MSTLGVCMITKDEADCITRCLESVRPFVDEIVVIDTGSRDRTPQIAKSFHAKVHKYKWRDDFAAARNESLRYATTDWILIIDSDEVMAANDMKKIKRLIDKKVYTDKLIGFTLEQRNYTNDSSIADWKASDNYKECEGIEGFFISPIVRLFKRDQKISFRFKVHEDIGRSIMENGGQIEHPAIPIHHYGFCKSESITKNKTDKYLQLGLEQIKKTPTHPKPYFELGKIYNNKGEHDKAIKYFKKVISINPKFAKAHTNLGDAYSRKGELKAALMNYRQAIELDPKEENALNNLGVILVKSNRAIEALPYFKQVVNNNPASAKGYKNLSNCLIKLNRLYEALQALKTAYQKTKISGFNQKYKNLKAALDKRVADLKAGFDEDQKNIEKTNAYSEILYRLRRFDEAREVLQTAVKVNQGNKSPEAVNLYFNLSNCLVELKEYHLASRVLEDAIELDPQAASFLRERQTQIMDISKIK